jgi:hypothetical protein
MTLGANAIKLRVTDDSAPTPKTSTAEGTVVLSAFPTPVAYWPMRDGLPGETVTGADDLIDDPTHPASDGVVSGNSNATWEADPLRGIVYSTSEGNRLRAGEQGIDLNVDAGWTWSLWAKVDSSNITDPGADCLIGTRNGAWNKMDRVSCSNWINPTYPDFADDTWRHIVFVGDVSGGSIYWDGVLQSKDTTFNGGSLLTNKYTLPLEIGGTTRYTEDITGRISDVAIWNIALTEDQILDLASGANLIADTTAPFLAATTPGDDDPAAPVGGLQAIFDEPVQPGSGDIRIVNLTDGVTTSIAVTDGNQVTVSGASITIAPAVALIAGKDYAVEMDAGVVQNVAGIAFGGILDQTTWNFTTDSSAPVLVSTSPEDDDANAPAGSLSLEFDETVVPGSGNIVLRNITDASDTTIAVDDTQVTFSGNIVTIAPAGGLLAGKAYAVQIDATAIKNLSGFTYAGIGDDTGWNFVVATATILTGTAGGDDSWNVSANWSAGVPISNIKAVISAGITAQVNNNDTPSYSGTLTIETGSILKFNEAGTGNNAAKFNALGTGGITMEANTEIDTATQADPVYPDLHLLGAVRFRSSSNAGDRDTRTFGGVISGPGSLTITGRNVEKWIFTQTNTFTGGLTLAAVDRYIVRAQAAGALGAGDVAVTPRANADLRSAVISIEAADAIADSATVSLEGTGGNNTTGFDDFNSTVTLIRMNFDDTIGALTVNGGSQPTGPYTDASGDWIDGAATLTVGGGGAPPYGTWAGGFAGLTNPEPSLDFDKGGLPTGIEWVVGGDPADGADDAGLAPGIDTTSSPGNALFVFRRADEAAADANTAIMVEYGSELQGWTEAQDTVDGVGIAVEDDGFGAGIDKVTVTLPAALAVGGELYARLNVVITAP